MDGALRHASRRLCRCGACGRQRPRDRAPARAQARRPARQRACGKIDAGFRPTSQPRDVSPLGKLQGRSMKNGKRYWAPIKSRFGNFAAWVDDEGRLLRFHLRAKGAEKGGPEAERREKTLANGRGQVIEYDNGTRRDFEFELAPDGPEFHKQV